MGKEIERRFLLADESWRGQGSGVEFRQGFLSTVKERVVRVRLAGGKGTLTIKGLTQGFSKLEFEYEIPPEEARDLLDSLCEKPLIEKTRYRIKHGGLVWEVDEFAGENNGLVLAEVELSHENQPIDKPAWLGPEISGDPRYFNSNLVKNPFSQWQTNA